MIVRIIYFFFSNEVKVNVDYYYYNFFFCIVFFIDFCVKVCKFFLMEKLSRYKIIHSSML